eukprot:gene3718-2617_t
MRGADRSNSNKEDVPTGAHTRLAAMQERWIKNQARHLMKYNEIEIVITKNQITRSCTGYIYIYIYNCDTAFTISNGADVTRVVRSARGKLFRARALGLPTARCPDDPNRDRGFLSALSEHTPFRRRNVFVFEEAVLPLPSLKSIYHECEACTKDTRRSWITKLKRTDEDGDARELAMFLMGFRESVQQQQHVVYVCAVLRRTFKQLCLDTLRRKLGEDTTAQPSRAARIVLRAWTSDLLEWLHQFLVPHLSLLLANSNNTTNSSNNPNDTKNINTAAEEQLAVSDPTSQPPVNQQEQQKEHEEVVAFEALEEACGLLHDLSCVECTDLLPRRQYLCPSYQRWMQRIVALLAGEADPPASSLDSSSAAAATTTALPSYFDITPGVLRVLSRCARAARHYDGAVSSLLHFVEENYNSEAGRRPSRQMLEQLVETQRNALAALPTMPPRAQLAVASLMQDSVFGLPQDTMLGSWSLFEYLMHHGQLSFAGTPQDVLFLLSPVATRCLEGNPGLFPQLRDLLRWTLESIPCNSIHFLHLDQWCADPQDQALPSSTAFFDQVVGCMTAQAQFIFELARALIEASLMAADDSTHADLRQTLEALLQRCSRMDRLQLLVLLLGHCPHASVAQFLLKQLQMDWKTHMEAVKAAEGGAGGFEENFSRLLTGCGFQLVQHILDEGRVDLVDTLIRLLNVWSVFFAADRHAPAEARRCVYATTTGRLAGTEAQAPPAGCRPWQKAALRMKALLSSCGLVLQRLAADPQCALDHFSLSSARVGWERETVQLKGFENQLLQIPHDLHTMKRSFITADAAHKGGNHLTFSSTSLLGPPMIRSDIFDNSPESGGPALRITPEEERRSTIFLTKFEVTRIVGERAKQIVNGTAPRVFSHGSLTSANKDAAEAAERCPDAFSLAVDPVMMAKYDLIQGKIPMLVQRTWPNGDVENIPINELQVDPLVLDLNY